MHLNEKRISMSLTTIDLKAEAGGKTTPIKHSVYFHGYDHAKARGGTIRLIESWSIWRYYWRVDSLNTEGCLKSF